MKIWLYSATGIGLVLVLLININFLLDRMLNFHFDITSDRLYTLTEGTRNILKSLQNPVTLRFYRTYRDNRMPPSLKIYSDKISNMLKEYVNAGKGKLILEEYDPVPDSDIETSAIIDNIEPKTLPNGDKCYFGLSFSCLDRNSSIPYLSPGNETTLEYDITRSIYDTATPRKVVVGILSSMPVMGNNDNIMPGQTGGNRRPPWIFVQELQKLFEVRNINYNATDIDGDISVLLVIHPAGLGKATEYAIDQYLLNGGRLLVFTDPYCFAASNSSEIQLFSSPPPPNASDLPELFSAWGIRFTPPGTVVIAPDNAYHVMNDLNSKEHPAILNLEDEMFNKKDIVMFGLNKLNMIFSGAFTGTPRGDVEKTVLLKTSQNTELLGNFSYYITPEEIMSTFKSSDMPQELIIRLTGRFFSAFPKGSPSDTKAGGSLKHRVVSVKESSVIISGDADMLFNPFCVAKQNIYGKEVVAPINNNIDFVLNAVDQLSGDLNIINIRGRGALERDFDRFDELFNAARKKFQAKIAGLNAKLKETEDYINSIQAGSAGTGSNSGLTSEQLKAIQKYRIRENETKKELKEVRRQLRADVDSLKIRIIVINMALVPLLLCVLGIVIGLRRKMKR